MKKGFRPYGEVSFDKKDYLWRYMDPQKFLSFILSKSFHFSRLDTLNDSLEGITASELIGRMDPNLISEYAAHRNVLLRTNATPTKSKLLDQIEQLRFRQKRYFVSCWFLGSRESFAMWNLYGNSSSVALKVKPNKLVSFLEDETAYELRQNRINEKVFGMVSYKDYLDRKAISSKGFKQMFTAFRKDLCWEHEKEFRVVINTKRAKVSHEGGLIEIEIPAFGFDLKIKDLSGLDISVVFHPDMTDWTKRSYRVLVDRLSLSGLDFRDSELIDHYKT